VSGPLVFGAVIVAAGRGVRFGRPKQLVAVGGRPLVAWSIETFGTMPEIAELAIATEPESVAALQELAERYAPARAVRVVAGGATRQASVARGIAALSATCEAVAIHDGARPLVLADDVRRAMAQVGAGQAAVLAAPVVDTIKRVPRDAATVAETLDRAELWAAQTPQLATRADLERAHAAAARDGIDATDDTALLERIGVRVVVVPPSGENFKVTLRADRELAESVLRERAGERARVEYRVGHGFDAHRLVEGRPFVLGGIEIPCAFGPLGHSDADVLAHALSDAILGACALGDLGAHFPDIDPQWKGADSMRMLEACVAMAAAGGYTLANVDVTVVVERPRLAPHLAAIRARVAASLRIERDLVSVKAKTSEGMGYTGDGTGIAAYAVAGLVRSERR